jgi:hypothetical protein
MAGTQTKNPVGRPKGDPSTIVNVRLPLALVAQLDRYLDWIETHTGQKVNRGAITRRVLQAFLERSPQTSCRPQQH